MRTCEVLLGLGAFAALCLSGCVTHRTGPWEAEPLGPVGRSAPLPAPATAEPPPAPLSFRPEALEVGTAPISYASAGPRTAPVRTLNVEPGPPPQRRPGGRYTVAPGETLMAIARNQLGDASRWRDIVAANPGLDPARIQAGQELKLPD